ncbi:bifunctional DNA primase/polymerase [Streptomyces demainii]|uniref:DNA primase n=1 Tax=Streptomyces demainii TaxID=588122 RepID=A0ABT9KK54_9ACTN|nr:bifunctional DNA primase/polymerase [Streptomyces demainii]MDP9608808.1 hypothetical protein [Streptomyces demainii]
MPYSVHWPEALANALRAAQRGLHVFPLTSKKLPAVRSPHADQPDAEPCRGECGRPGHGVHDATTVPADIRALFHAAPRATGYGIACGRRPMHLIGVDLDRKNGLDGVAALRDLAHKHGFDLPGTVTIATPSGGLHLWLSGPAGVVVPNSASRLGPGIDIRGTGGYLVGPGSWTPAGVYRVLAHSTPVPQPVPAALLQLLLPPPAQERPRPAPSAGCGTSSQASDALVRFVRDSPEGQLNNRLYWAACRAFESGEEADSVAAELLAAACAAGHPERGAARTIASARSRVAGRAGR